MPYAAAPTEAASIPSQTRAQHPFSPSSIISTGMTLPCERVRAPPLRPAPAPDTCRSLPEGAAAAPGVSCWLASSVPAGWGAVPPSTTTLRQVLRMGDGWQQARSTRCTVATSDGIKQPAACTTYVVPAAAQHQLHLTKHQVLRSVPGRALKADAQTSPSSSHPTCVLCRARRSLDPAPAASPPPVQRPCGVSHCPD